MATASITPDQDAIVAEISFLYAALKGRSSTYVQALGHTLVR